jgi:hypothetical protein
MEIASIQTALLAGVPVEPWPFVDRGRRIRLKSGPIEGVEGFLVDGSTPHRFVVSLPVLRQSLALEIERRWLRPPEVNDGASQRSDVAVRGVAQS